MTPAKHSFLYDLFCSDGVPSTRVVSAFCAVLAAIGLEFWFATPDNVISMVNSNFLAAGTFYGIYRIGKTVEAVGSAPTVDNSKTEIKSEQTDVSATNINMNPPAQ